MEGKPFWVFTAFLRSINSLRKCLVRLSRSIASGTDFKPRANPGFSGRVAGHYESAPQAEAIALRRAAMVAAVPKVEAKPVRILDTARFTEDDDGMLWA